MTAPIAPSLAEVIRHFTNRDLDEISTAFPAMVLKHDAERNEVDVLPLVLAHTRESSDRKVLTEYAVLPGIPVCYPRWGKVHMRAPLAKFDHVLCVTCESSIGAWRESAGDRPVDPQDHERFNPGFSVAIPGFYPQRKLPTGPAPAKALELGLDNGGRILIDTEDGSVQVYVPPPQGGDAIVAEFGFEKDADQTPKVKIAHPDKSAILMFKKTLQLMGPGGAVSIVIGESKGELNGTWKVNGALIAGPAPVLTGTPASPVPSTSLLG